MNCKGNHGLTIPPNIALHEYYSYTTAMASHPLDMSFFLVHKKQRVTVRTGNATRKYLSMPMLALLCSADKLCPFSSTITFSADFYRKGCQDEPGMALACKYNLKSFANLDPVLNCTQSCAKGSECRMRPFVGHQEGSCLCFAACFLQLLCNFFYIPAPLLLRGQQVVDQVRVEDGGDAFHCQLLIQEQGKEFRIAVRIVNLEK